MTERIAGKEKRTRKNPASKQALAFGFVLLFSFFALAIPFSPARAQASAASAKTSSTTAAAKAAAAAAKKAAAARRTSGSAAPSSSSGSGAGPAIASSIGQLAQQISPIAQLASGLAPLLKMFQGAGGIEGILSKLGLGGGTGGPAPAAQSGVPLGADAASYLEAKVRSSGALLKFAGLQGFQGNPELGAILGTMTKEQIDGFVSGVASGQIDAKSYVTNLLAMSPADRTAQITRDFGAGGKAANPPSPAVPGQDGSAAPSAGTDVDPNASPIGTDKAQSLQTLLGPEAYQALAGSGALTPEQIASTNDSLAKIDPARFQLIAADRQNDPKFFDGVMEKYAANPNIEQVLQQVANDPKYDPGAQASGPALQISVSPKPYQAAASGGESLQAAGPAPAANETPAQQASIQPAQKIEPPAPAATPQPLVSASPAESNPPQAAPPAQSAPATYEIGDLGKMDVSTITTLLTAAYGDPALKQAIFSDLSTLKLMAQNKSELAKLGNNIDAVLGDPALTEKLKAVVGDAEFKKLIDPSSGILVPKGTKPAAPAGGFALGEDGQPLDPNYIMKDGIIQLADNPAVSAPDSQPSAIPSVYTPEFVIRQFGLTTEDGKSYYTPAGDLVFVDQNGVHATDASVPYSDPNPATNPATNPAASYSDGIYYLPDGTQYIPGIGTSYASPQGPDVAGYDDRYQGEGDQLASLGTPDKFSFDGALSPQGLAPASLSNPESFADLPSFLQGGYSPSSYYYAAQGSPSEDSAYAAASSYPNDAAAPAPYYSETEAVGGTGNPQPAPALSYFSSYSDPQNALPESAGNSSNPYYFNYAKNLYTSIYGASYVSNGLNGSLPGFGGYSPSLFDTFGSGWNGEDQANVTQLQGPGAYGNYGYYDDGSAPAFSEDDSVSS